MFSERKNANLSATIAQLRTARENIARLQSDRAAKKAKSSLSLLDPNSLGDGDRDAWFETKRGLCPPKYDDQPTTAWKDVPTVAQRTASAMTGRAAAGPQHEKLEREYAKHFGTDTAAALAKVDSLAVNAYIHSIKHTTRASYESGVARWEYFCNFFGIAPYPVTEEMCERFVAATSVSCTADTASQYLSAVRDKCLGIGASMPERANMPRLQRTLRGLKMAELQTKEGRVRMALTFDIARTTLIAVEQRDRVPCDTKGSTPSPYSIESYVLIRAMISLPLVALLRPSEAFVRTTSKGIVSAPLLVKHWIQIGHDSDETLVTGANLSLPHRKTDQFGERSLLFIGPTGDKFVCAVSAVNELLLARQRAGEIIAGDSPLLLVEKDGKRRAMSYSDLTSALSAVLRLAGFDDSKFKGHSFRIGGATSLALMGVPTNAIETMGGWAPGSLSLPGYIRQQIVGDQRRLMCSFFNKPYIRRDQGSPVVTSPPIAIAKCVWQT